MNSAKMKYALAGCRNRYVRKIIPAGKISRKQMDHALNGFADGCRKSEVICMLDFTLFHTGKKGIVYTERGVYSNLFSKSKVHGSYIAYETIKGADPTFFLHDYVWLNFKPGYEEDDCLVFKAGKYSPFLIHVFNRIVLFEILHKGRVKKVVRNEETDALSEAEKV